MEPATWWEMLLGGLVAILVVWFRPGAKAAIERSRVAKKDWPAALIPLALVVLFVILLIKIVRG